jgi:hypothetical protein
MFLQEYSGASSEQPMTADMCGEGRHWTQRTFCILMGSTELLAIAVTHVCLTEAAAAARASCRGRLDALLRQPTQAAQTLEKPMAHTTATLIVEPLRVHFYGGKTRDMVSLFSLLTFPRRRLTQVVRYSAMLPYVQEIASPACHRHTVALQDSKQLDAADLRCIHHLRPTRQLRNRPNASKGYGTYS